ncbi:hypothetical protein [Burkholderia sp. AW49-1]
MPRKPKAQPAALPAIPAELLEPFGNGPMTAEAINEKILLPITPAFWGDYRNREAAQFSGARTDDRRSGRSVITPRIDDDAAMLVE